MFFGVWKTSLFKNLLIAEPHSMGAALLPSNPSMLLSNPGRAPLHLVCWVFFSFMRCTMAALLLTCHPETTCCVLFGCAGGSTSAFQRCTVELRICFSPCQNGGTCVEASGSAADPSCLCPPGFSGALCDISAGSCQPNPCLNGGNCTDHGLAFTCACPPGYTGFTCNDTSSLSACAGAPCANDGTCVGQSDGTFRCICQKWYSGPTCSLHHRQRSRTRPANTRPVEHRGFALTPQHYSLPAHAFHKLLRPPERDLLKITLKESVHSTGVLVTHGQLICFGMLALLTCLVILGTTGIVFFGRCETWLANAKYSQLVRQQREHLLREAGSASQEEPEHSVNIILPEKIRLSSFGRHYTSI
uniref:Delta like non-canonical Notch ligand 1 n=1 Tax=Xiphophorus couchianus TaxID=32473 RepID=A0A3B5LEG8_9TELE